MFFYYWHNEGKWLAGCCASLLEVVALNAILVVSIVAIIVACITGISTNFFIFIIITGVVYLVGVTISCFWVYFSRPDRFTYIIASEATAAGGTYSIEAPYVAAEEAGILSNDDDAWAAHKSAHTQRGCIAYMTGFRIFVFLLWLSVVVVAAARPEH